MRKTEVGKNFAQFLWEKNFFNVRIFGFLLLIRKMKIEKGAVRKTDSEKTENEGISVWEVANENWYLVLQVGLAVGSRWWPVALTRTISFLTIL